MKSSDIPQPVKSSDPDEIQRSLSVLSQNCLNLDKNDREFAKTLPFVGVGQFGSFNGEAKAGMIRFNGTKHQGYDGTTWQDLY